MKPHLHAKGSAKRYGGVPEDYVDIHEFMDSTKSSLADHRHRAILHSTFGIFLVEKVFGSTRTNSAGRVYSVRDVCEDHVIEDLGRIPTMEQWLRNMRLEPWMGGANRREAKRSLDKKKEDKKIIPNPVDDYDAREKVDPWTGGTIDFRKVIIRD